MSESDSPGVPPAGHHDPSNAAPAASRLVSLLAKIRDGAGQFLDAFQRAISGEGGITWPLFTLEIADLGNGGTIEIPGERPPVTILNFAICRLNVPVSETDVGTAARYLRDGGLPHDAQRLEDEFQNLKNAFFSVGEYVALPDGTMANRKFLAQTCAVALLGHLNDLIGAIHAVRPAGDRKSRVQAAVCDGQPGGAGDETAPDLHRKFMEMAIDEARKSVSEKGRDNPKVGVVVVRDRIVLAASHRGELGMGEHAEFTALEKKLPDETLGGTTVYTTLEPCTTRNHPKVPCASRLIERRVTRVVIGMLDPNPAICGRGERLLRDHGIEVERFPHDLIVRLEELNRDFTRTQRELPGGKKIESPTDAEYQRRVIDRLARLSDELYSEFNPASEDYLTAHRGLQEAVLLIHKDFEQSKDAILAAGEWEGWVLLPRDTVRLEKILAPVRSDPFIPEGIRKVVIEHLERRLAAFTEISNELLLEYRNALASGKIKPDKENWLPIINRMNREMTIRNCSPAQIEAEVHKIRGLIQECCESLPHGHEERTVR